MFKTKVVFLFTSNGAAQQGSYDEWNPKHKCAQHYVDHHSQEGYMKMLGKLKDMGVIDDLKIFFESNRGHGLAEFYPGVYGEVLPEIRFVDRFIDKDTIIFARGGFKGWHDWLKSKKGKNWLLVYPANTGRERWTWWDIIFEDRTRVNTVDRYERFWHWFVKPVNEECFYPIDYIEKIYDICIGASHIHDKKGQWKVVKTLIEYKKKYNKNLKCIMPGSFRKGIRSKEILHDIKSNNLDVYLPGMVSRSELNTFLNQSKLFIHFGAHGQNDRGPIESLATGIPILIGSPKYHSPLINEFSCGLSSTISTWVQKEEFEGLAVLINGIFSEQYYLNKEENLEYYDQFCSMRVILRRMSTLFSFLSYRKPTLANKIEMASFFKEFYGD